MDPLRKCTKCKCFKENSFFLNKNGDKILKTCEPCRIVKKIRCLYCDKICTPRVMKKHICKKHLTPTLIFIEN